MKNTLLFVALISAFTFTSCKENAGDKVNNDNVTAAETRDANAGKFPVLTFAEAEFDFGTIEQGTAVEHAFKFKNEGDAPLMIVDAKSTCGCTVPTPPKDPIAPGEEGELLVKFNGSGKNQVSKTVTITANTKGGTQTIKIKAFVNPKEGAATPIAIPQAK